MNAREFFQRAAELERARTPFAVATVVKRDGPISSHVGDCAIILADGRMQGFVGGSCSHDAVREEALAALRTGSARLVQIEGECASEGGLDVYVEPHLPSRLFIIAGATPTAFELARLAAVLENYRVIRVVDAAELESSQDGAEQTIVLDALADFLAGLHEEDRTRLVAVVASQGHYDERALEVLLRVAEPVYLGLLASRRRAAAVFADAQRLGVDRERLTRVRNPAGLDLGARRPADVAISILAEIVATLCGTRVQAAG